MLETWKAMEKEKKLSFITISREYGCQGYPIAENLQNKLNSICDKEFPWMVFDRILAEKIANEHHLSKDLIESLNDKHRSEISQVVDSLFFDRPDEYTIFQLLASTIIGLAQKGHAIIMGRGACVIARDIKKGFHIRLFAPTDFRIKKVEETRKVSSWEEAKSLVKKMDKERESFVKRFAMKSVSDLNNFDMIINVEKNTIEEVTDIIISALKAKKLI
jgi:cytidylate kinase